MQTKKGRRICVFGGTFDPIHIAHIRIAEEALQKFALDKVMIVPARSPAHKDAFVPYISRLRMVKLACEGHPGLHPSALEADSGQSYTVDTMRRVRAKMPHDKIFFLIGADAFDDFESWKGWQELVTLTDFIVVARPESQYRVPPGAKVHQLDGLSLQVSSSGIRASLAADEATPELDDKVRAYIERRGLYGSKTKKPTVSL